MTKFPKTTVPQRFAHFVDTQPLARAILAPGDPWSYRDLDRAIRALQAQIRAARIPEQSVICLALADPCWTVAAMLATLRERHIYCALDGRQPTEWLLQVLRTSAATAIFTDEKSSPRFAGAPAAHLRLFASAEPVPSDLSLHPDLTPADPAYVTFTSGSTGTPKGILHSHENLLHEVEVHTATLGITPRDRFSALYGLHAVGSNRDLYAALLNGAAYCPFPHGELGMGELKQWLRETRVSILHAVPPLYRELLRGLAPNEVLPSVRVTFLAGDKVVPEDVLLHRIHFPSAEFYTGIGATETSSLYCHGFIPPDATFAEGTVPSGKPVEGYEVTIEEAGEIVVSSPYLALGYLGEVLPGKGFRVNPRTGKRAFFTGDRGNFDESGNLHFHGRLDHRVKINGQLVETSDVERKLRAVAGVQDCLVRSVDIDGKARLLAYLIGPERTPSADLREHLLHSLPAYAIPHEFLWLDRFPLTETGKVDRHRLPLPSAEGAATTAPSDETFTTLLAIWKRVFPRATADRNADFHTLGGDSLATVNLIAELEEKFSLVLTPADFLHGLTLGSLYERVLAAPAARSESPAVLGRREMALLKAATTYSAASLAGRPFAQNVGLELGETRGDRPALVWLQVRTTPHLIRLLAEVSACRTIFWLPSGYRLLDDKPGTSARLFEFYAQSLRERGIRRVEVAGLCHAGILAMELAGVLREKGLEVEDVLVFDHQPPLPPPLEIWKTFALRIRRKLARRKAGVNGTLSGMQIAGAFRAKFFDQARHYFRYRRVVREARTGTCFVTNERLRRPRWRWAKLFYFRGWRIVPLEGDHFSLLTEAGGKNYPRVLAYLREERDGKGTHAPIALAPLSAGRV